MSTTLTNGLKLPDKGSVDWYADMQNNYAILDGAVGTVAEHTSQIAGKAPAVHTHTKSDITDFPAYGTTAGTICEGNDSRLSDARTPVAHTHVTADVTDFPDMALYPYKLAYTDNGGNFPYINLADSDHIALGFNGITDTGIYKVRATADVPGTPNALTLDGILIVFNSDGTANVSSHRRCQQIFYQNSTTPKIFKRIGVFNITSQTWNWDTYKWVEYANTGRDFIPNETNSLNIGSSSYQWNNLHANNYYYNGVAWGLDKANVWSQSQTISANTNKAYIITNTSYTLGEETPSTTKELGGVFFKDSNGNNAAYVNVGHEKTTGDVYTRILTRFKFDNGVKSISGSTVNTALDIGLTNSGEKFVRPSVNSEVNLGTSTSKWKTLNGINPGALSLPDSASFVDISGSITNLDGTDNFYTPSVNGWISVCVGNNSPSLSMYCDRNNSWGASFAPTNTNKIFGILPLVAGNRVRIRTVCGALIYARFYPCLGNV